MTILEFKGEKIRDAYPELRQAHMEFCLRDAFALCLAAARECHTALAETLTAVHGMHRTFQPRISVNFNSLMMAIEAGDGDDAETMVRRSRQSPRIDGALSSDRDLIKRYVLSDTRPAIQLMIEQSLSDPDDLAYLQNIVAERRFDDLRTELADILPVHYTSPSGNEWHAAINDALVSANLQPYPDKAAAAPARRGKPRLTLVPPGA